MKIISLVIVLIAFLNLNTFKSVKNPQSDIRSESITARLCLPDTVNGYYMGTRFDWSGQISDLTFNGHTYFGKWYDVYSPSINDAIMGPVEEFGPLGYDEAKTGDNFVMIGVGVLKKPEEKSHNRFGYYQIVNHGNWTVKTKSDQVHFIHELNNNGYAYEYTKTVRLVKDKPVLELSHILKNTGQRIIETNVYNHNFFVIDNQPVGPDFVMTFPYTIKGEGQGIGTIAEIKDNKIVFSRELTKGESIFCGSLTGFRNDPKDLDIRIENKKTGAGVRITGDQPLLKLIFWACSTTLCPETYVDIKIKPGEEFRWKFFYEFNTFDLQK